MVGQNWVSRHVGNGMTHMEIFMQISTPIQFSVSMLTDLLNSKGHALQTPGPVMGPDGQFGIQTFSSTSVSFGGVPGGLQLGGLNASAAANEVIDGAGSNGKLNLSDVDNALGINAPETGYTSPEAITSLEWARLAGSAGGTMTTAQLTNAIQSYLNTQSTMPPQSNTPMLKPIGQSLPI